MEEIKNLLEAREDYLIQLKKNKEKSLQFAPEGSLRINRRGTRMQYYHRNDPKDFTGKYIRRENFELVHKLAQKDYDKKILDALEKELEAIKKYYLNYPDRNVERIYESLHEERQKLITPILETDEEFVRKWETVTYQGKEFSEGMPEIYTAKDERVRSKSEMIIADLLSKEGIPYRYEYPVYLKNFGRVHPDFMALNVEKREEVLWEHLGMMDDENYAEKNIRKIAAYIQNGYYPGDNLILTFETRNTPINQKLIMQMIQHYLK